MAKRSKALVKFNIDKVDYPNLSRGRIISYMDEEGENEEPVFSESVQSRIDTPDQAVESDHVGERKYPAAKSKGGLPGQLWRARIKRKKAGIVEVNLWALLKKSKIEKAAECSDADHCGGCNYQTLPYETELMIKGEQMNELYAPVFKGRVPLFPSPIIEAYRNKMEYTFGDRFKGGPLCLGLHKPKHYYDILSTEACNIVPDDFNKIRAAVEKFARDKGLTFYHRLDRRGYLRHLVIRSSRAGDQLMINLVTRTFESEDAFEHRSDSNSDNSSEAGPDREIGNFLHGEDKILNDFTNRLRSLSLTGNLISIYHTRNDSPADAVIAEDLTLLWGKAELEEEISGLNFKIGPFSFFQPNVAGAEKLYKKAMEFAGDLSGKTVYDLYCGTGTLTQIAGQKAQRVIGVEIVEEAVEKARLSAMENGMVNVKFIVDDVLKQLADLAEKGDKPDLVLLDPPREGVHPKAVKYIIEAQPEKIVYISCNPKSQIRDLELFLEGGYKIEKIAAFDQFPRTKHVVLGELKTKSGKNLFRKLNEYSKELQVKQEEIVKKHNSLSEQYDELERLKNNLNEYLGRGKQKEKKESVIGAIREHRSEERGNPKEKNKISKEAER